MAKISLWISLLLVTAPLAAQIDPDCVINGWTCYLVDRFDDAPAATACTPAATDCSLRGALTRANQDGVKSKLRLPAGEYLLTVPGADEDGNLTGDLDVAGETKVAPTGTSAVTITQVAADRIFHLLAGAGDVILEGLTIRGGSPPGASAHGGGIYSSNSGSLSLIDVILAGDVAGGQGGGLYFWQPSNTGTQLTLDRVVISGCESSVYGGGLLVDAAGDGVEIVDSEIRDNRAGFEGGGLHVASGNASILRTTLAGNHAGSIGSDGYGGGASFQSTATLQLADSTVTDNSAGVAGSVQGHGGGVYAAGTLSLRNSTVSGNWIVGPAAEAGTELYIANGGGGQIEHATLVRAAAEAGHAAVGVGPSSVVSFGRSVIDGGCANDLGVIASLGGNVERPEPSTSGCGLALPSDLVVSDARLRPLSGYGGPTRTHMPFADSPVVDHVTSLCDPFDQRGATRGSTCDAGSFELAPLIPPPGPWIFADGFASGNALAWSAEVP